MKGIRRGRDALSSIKSGGVPQSNDIEVHTPIFLQGGPLRHALYSTVHVHLSATAYKSPRSVVVRALEASSDRYLSADLDRLMHDTVAGLCSGRLV